MSKARKDSVHGLTKKEWIDRSIQSSKSDPIGLWSIVRIGRRNFGLTENDLTLFVTEFIKALIESGSGPIVGDSESKKWVKLESSSQLPEQIADEIVRQWISSGSDPDVSGVWFGKSS